MSDIHFYSGYVKTDINEPFVFEVEELEIEKVFEDGTIKLKHPYFYCSSDSTSAIALAIAIAIIGTQ